MNYNFSFLTKGYKGNIQGPEIVNNKIHSITETGDEARLLAATSQTIIAKNRQKAINFLKDNANDILAEVAVEMDSEKPFYVAGCAWHGNGQTKTGGDNFHERSTPQGIALEPGANHYAVNKDSRFEPRYPMLASGFSSTVGQYAMEKADLGGIWEGKTAVIIYGTGDAEIVKLDLSGKAMKDMGGRSIDLFDYQGKVQMVNPQRGN